MELGPEKRLAISFSGGQTSAYMTRRLLSEYRHSADIRITFANTGQEHERTLDFVDKCERYFHHEIVWVESAVNPEHGKGIRHKIVTFDSASRDAEPFRDVIAKYGIPGPTHPQCSDRLKRQPMEDYFRAIGWRPKTEHPEYDTAIGIRYDEFDRMNASRKKWRLVYPLVDWKVTKNDVHRELASWPFQLGLKEHLGNCTTCWKKTLRKLATVYLDSPKEFDFNREMERDHGKLKAVNANGERRFFRGNRNVDDIAELAQSESFRRVDAICRQGFLFDIDYEMDIPAGLCGSGESCEVY